jgi:pimeloyl-ACP methyl ester carboxylesterase
MPTAKIRGLNINYEVVGDDGPWMTLITGGRRGYREVIPLAHRIADRGFRVLLHDRRNTGASDMLLDDAEVEEAVWADDLNELLEQLNAAPAFIGGSSSGARTALMFAVRHPGSVRALLLLRVSGGPVAATRLPENYYGQFIRIAKDGGMAAICETERFKEYIEANPSVRGQLMGMDPKRFIQMQSRLLELFLAGANLPVMGMTETELRSIAAPTIIIPGNDNTHSSQSGRIAHQMIRGSELHQLPVEDEDVPLIPWSGWADHEPEIAQVFADFMERTSVHTNA